MSKKYLMISGMILQNKVSFTPSGCLLYVMDVSKTLACKESSIKLYSHHLSSFNVSKELSNYGVVIFSDAGEFSSLRLRFDEIFDLEAMVRRIERMPYKGYRTRIDLALQIADKDLFSAKGGKTFIPLIFVSFIFSHTQRFSRTP